MSLLNQIDGDVDVIGPDGGNSFADAAVAIRDDESVGVSPGDVHRTK